MKSKRISCRCVLMMLVVSVLFFCGAKAHAVPTKQLSYQGRLNNAGGQPVPDGTYTIVFSIYNAAAGGAALWTETQNVSVANGGFSVYLGSVTAITLPFNEDYFLGIKVASDPEMTPRLKLSVVGAAAYSLESEKLQGKAASDFALATHTHTGLSATTVNGYSVNATPTASTLLPLDSGAKFPTSVLNVGTTTGTIAAGDHTHTASGVTQIIAGTNVTVSPAGGTGVVTINSTPATGFVQLTPSSAQTMQATADVTPLIIKDDTAGTTADLLDVQDNAGTSLVKVNPAGKLFIGAPTTTSPKVSILDSTGGTAFYSEVSGVTGYAGIFKTSNSSNPNETLNITASGTGSGIWISQTGTGKGIILETNNATNASSLIYGNIVAGTGNLIQLLSGGTTKFVVTNTGNLLVGNPTVTTAKLSFEETGTNYAGYFKINNASNTNMPLLATTNGSGAAFSAQTTGTGAASYFLINNATNAQTLIVADTFGTGNLLQLQKSGADQVVVNNSGNLLVGNPTVTTAKISAEETGTANFSGYFKINNAANPFAGVYVITGGTGMAGQFQISNAANSNPAVYSSTAGTGSAISGVTTGTGQAGGFQINNASNSDPAVYAGTTGTGSLFKGNATGTGNLLQLQQSGVDKFVVSNTGVVTASSFAVGTDKTIVSPAALQQKIQSGNACEALATNGFINITFPTAFTSPPNVVALPSREGTGTVNGLRLNTTSDITTSGVAIQLMGHSAGDIECVQWIAVGN